MTKPSVKILGLSFFYHDSAAALIIDGKVVAAAQEERFTRIKNDESFPIHAINYCLRFAKLDISNIDYIVFYEKPILKFERLLHMYVKTWPKGLRSFISAMRVWFKDKLWVEDKIRTTLSYSGKILFTEHHYAHAASSYYCSDFDESTIVTMDGVGEWETVAIGYGHNNEIKLTKTIDFPHSLGMLYSALTYYLGFKVNSDEYKVMGLAPYGNPEKYVSQFRKLITIHDDGSFVLNMDYFAYNYDLTMISPQFYKLFGGPARKSGAIIEQEHKDIAAALQKITEEAILKIVKYAKQSFPSSNLCLGGGVALNCVANGKILSNGLFKNIYIQPAAGDAGAAIGAALYIYHTMLAGNREKEVMPNAFLGTSYSNTEIEAFLDQKVKDQHGIIAYRKISDEELIFETARLINDDKIIGWFQGRMEFGPRALGARSILADARRAENLQRINLKIKSRESFRPLAPAVLFEETKRYFKLECPSPYMLLTAEVKDKDIPAVTHIDGSARIQTVNHNDNPLFYRLLKEFHRQSGCAVIINTSFNAKNKPIVESLDDALNCFIDTEMDRLILGNFIIEKKNGSY